jgi:hypothetical protein
MAEAVVEVGVRGGEQSLAAWRQAGHRLLDPGEHAVMEFPVQGQQVFRAVAEVVEERALRHAGLGDDAVDAHAGQAGPLGQGQAGGDELVAGRGGARLPDAHCLAVVTDARNGIT